MGGSGYLLLGVDAVCMRGGSSTRRGNMVGVAAAFSQSSDESTVVHIDDGRY